MDSNEHIIFSVNEEISMASKAPSVQFGNLPKGDAVFDKAAEIFRVMSAPMRLRIITLYQAGILGKRREGVQIYYSIVNTGVVNLCRAVCEQIQVKKKKKI